MLQISTTTDSNTGRRVRERHLARLALLLLLGTAGIASTAPALADLPPKPAPQPPKEDPQVKSLVAAAIQAERQGNLSLASIQLKNALRISPTNGAVRAQLGVIMLESGDIVPAEQELRQARINGAKEENWAPALMQAMLTNKETNDLLDQFPDPGPNNKSKMASITLRARALAYQAGGDAINAISSMDRSLAINKDLAGLLSRAQIAILQSQPQDAIKYINQAIAMAPDNVNALLMKAAVFRFTDKKGSIALLDSILKAHPENLKARIAKIELLVEMNQIDEAQKNIDAALKLGPDLPATNFYQALVLGIRHKSKEGWRIAQALSPEFVQSDARIATGTAQLAAESGNLESANSILSAFVARNPNNVEARLRLAAMRIKLNNAASALEALAPMANSQDSRALELLAAAYDKLNQPQNALIYLRKAEAAGSKSGAVKYQIAIADIRAGNSQKGAQELIEIVKQMPGNLTGPGIGIDFLIKQGKIADALTVIDQADKLSPKNPIPPFFRAEILVAQNKLDNGIAMFGQSLGRDGNYVPSLYGRAQVYIAQKKFKEATADLMRAQARQPASPLSYIKLAEIAALGGNSGQALSLLKTAVDKAPAAIDTRIVMARYQISIKQNAQAQQTLQDALKIDPNNPQLLALLGNTQQRMGQKAAAVDTNKKLAQKYQLSGAAQYLLANSFMANGDKKSAIAAMRKATELSPEVVQYRTLLITTLMETGDNDGAIASARDWAANHKGPDGAVMIGETLMRAKRLPEAEAVVQKAQADHPEMRLAMLESQIAMERGNEKRSLSVLKDWLGDHSTDIPVRQAYAAALMRGNQNDVALQQYELIMKSKDDIPDVLNNLAWLTKDSNSARALSLSWKAWQLSPNSADIGDTYGWLLLRKGDAKGAVPILQRAHALAPDNGEISYHLAQAFSNTGRKADAKSLLQAAIAKNQNFNGAADAKKLLQTL